MSNVEVFEATRTGPNSRKRKQVTGYRAPDRIRVSTDDDEQLGSFESQKKYYEEKINSKKEWVMAGIFADEAITGTKVDKRIQFQEMIARCMDAFLLAAVPYITGPAIAHNCLIHICDDWII